MTAAPAAQELSPWTLWFGGFAFFACYLGQTVLGIVQPTIAADLDLSASEAQWVVNAFFLTLALFAAPGGRLGDYYGHRQVLIVALAIFALGSLSAAVSQGFAWLVLSIGVAGIGASTLYPSSAAMIANRVPAEHRGDALGKYSAIGVSVFLVGPVLAGLLTEAIDWRAIFVFDAAFAIGLAAIGLLRVDNRPVGAPEPFDARGFAVLLVGLTALLVALMQALTWGWHAPPTLLLFAAGLAILAGFVALELRTAQPLLDVALLRRRVLAGIVLAMFGAQVVVTGFVIYGATYFQHVLGFGPLVASLAIASAMFAEPLFNILAGRVTDRVGPRRPALFGYLLTAAALVWVAAFADEDSYFLLLPGLLVMNVSIAPMFTSLLTGLSNAVAAEERGDANALVLTVRWIGAAAGTMVLGVVIHSGNGAVVTDASPYASAFAILAGAALLGALACASLLRGPAAATDPEPVS
ncbi:MAG TPA: MFS transporter [Solirubrobacterales bacterium]|nr:MFS transporter [Solirubrobacterales bacterium]